MKTTKALQKSSYGDKLQTSTHRNLEQYKGTALFIPQTKVTLNWWAVILFGFTFFSLGTYWSSLKNEKVDLSKLEYRQEQILKLMAQKNNLSSQDSHQVVTAKVDPSITAKTGELLRSILKESGLTHKEELIEKQVEIENLKHQLRLMAEIRPSLKRMPAAIKQQQKTIPYNNKNASMLWFEQEVEKKGYLKQFKQERETFLSQNDLSNPLIKQKFDELKKNHKLVMHELEVEHDQERLLFKKNKYRVIK